MQVRNRGTVGGNVCSNDPTNHLPPVMVALGRDHDDRRRGRRARGLRRGLLPRRLHDRRRPRRAADEGHAARRGGAGDGFAAITIGADGTCIVNAAATVSGGEARVALGCVSATPVLLTGAAEDEAVREAVGAAAIDPPSDVHGSADYRRHLAEVVAARAVADAKEGS